MISETALAHFLAARTARNRDELVAAYWYLCVRAAKRFYRADIDRADLRQVGAIGLMKAIDAYDPQLRTPFEAYAWLLIVGELLHYVRDHERIVRTPRRLRALERRYTRACDSLATELGRNPSALELAAELGVDLAVLDEIRLLRRNGAMVSLDVCAPTEAPGASRIATSRDEHLTLRAAIDELAEREQVALLGSFVVGLSQAEIGTRLHLSQSQVSKLIKRALEKLQERVA